MVEAVVADEATENGEDMRLAWESSEAMKEPSEPSVSVVTVRSRLMTFPRPFRFLFCLVDIRRSTEFGSCLGSQAAIKGAECQAQSCEQGRGRTEAGSKGHRSAAGRRQRREQEKKETEECEGNEEVSARRVTNADSHKY